MNNKIERINELIDKSLSKDGAIFEYYPEDFIESRTDYERVKEIATNFYYCLKEIQSIIKNDK